MPYPCARQSADAATAQALRSSTDIGTRPMPHLVRTMEVDGIVVTLLPFAKDEKARIDARTEFPNLGWTDTREPDPRAAQNRRSGRRPPRLNVAFCD